MTLSESIIRTSIGYLVTDLTRLFGRVFDRRAAHLGLTRVQWRALKRIHLDEGMTQAALADVLDMEPIAVGRVVDRLQKAGFVDRQADPDDRRCWCLHLTPQSLQVMDGIEAVARSRARRHPRRRRCRRIGHGRARAQPDPRQPCPARP